MSDLTCNRCQAAGAPPLDFAPWPGALGRQLQQTVCANCWNEWLGLQTKIINEYRLNVLDPGHSKALRDQMEIFFGFKKAEPAPGEGNTP